MALETTDIPAPKQSSAVNPQESELYRQISREDEEGPILSKKKQQSPLMDFVVSFMRATLYIDSIRRSNELTFRRLGKAWAVFMGILYISGILMIVFSIYNRLQLPYYLESQLKARQIQFESAQYDMDRIEVRQLKGPDGLYTVDTLIMNTTFTDLLQKRIRSVVLDGVNIYLGTQSDFNPIKDIPAILNQLQHPTQGESDLTINALTVNNAKLNFEKGQMALPLSFSMEGIYDDTTQIIIPVSFDKPNLMFKGVLAISSDGDNPEWTLKISKGNVTLPRRAPEDFTGEIKTVLNEQKLDSISAAVQLGGGTIRKEIRLELQPTEDDHFAGTFSWSRQNTTEPTLSSDLTIDLPSLSFSEKEALKMQGIVTIGSKQFNLYNISFKNLNTKLDADIICTTWKQCTASVVKNSDIVIPELQFEHQRQTFKAESPVTLTLKPQRELVLMDATQPDFHLAFNLGVQNLVFEGKKTDSSEKLDITSEKANLKAVWSDASRIAVNFKGLNYDSPTTSFKNATLDIADLLQSTAQIKMQAQDMRLINQPLLSQPFEMNFNMVGSQAAARLKFKEQPIVIGLEGTLALPQRAFSGKLDMAPFDLKDLTLPLNELWPDIPETVKNAKGKVAARGLLNWSNGHASGNPLYIGLKDVSFDLGKTKIEGVNTVLAAESLLPLTTKPSQHIFVQNIQSLIPIQDVYAEFQLDNQSLKMNQLLAAVATIPVMLPPSIITPKNNGLMLYLKNTQPVNLKQVQKAINLPGFKIAEGIASLSIPIEFQEGTFDIPNVTFKVQDTQLNWAKSPSSAFGNSTGYIIRNGQFILDQDKMLRMSLNGRVLPSKKPKEVQFQQIPLPEDFISTENHRGPPKDILGWQKVLFGEESP